jgi:hypothetical protein
MIQLNRLLRANKEGRDRRMVEIRYIILMTGCIVAMIWLMVHVCFIGS